MSRKEIPMVQADADVLVLALPKGNGNLCLPSKLTSYMLSGKPILASVDDESSTKRILESKNCGITVPPDDIKFLTRAFEEFGKMSREKMLEMGKNCRKYAIANLTREINLNKVVESINNILR